MNRRDAVVFTVVKQQQKRKKRGGVRFVFYYFFFFLGETQYYTRINIYDIVCGHSFSPIFRFFFILQRIHYGDNLTG